MIQSVSNNSYSQFLRNPIGLIGLITVVFESIAVVALTTGIDKLVGSTERLPLIWMVAGFPVLVFLIFAVLVMFFHKNLYSPGDYRNERLFVEKDQKLASREMDYEAKSIVKEEELPDTPVNINGARLEIQKAETIGLMAACNYFGITLRKDVGICSAQKRRLDFDGMAFKGDTLCVAEVKFLVVTKGWKTLLGRYINQMQHRLSQLSVKHDALLVLVIRRKENEVSNAEIEEYYYTHAQGFGLKIVEFPADK